MTAKPLFNLSSGRTGSTLLQKFLNVSGDIVMWGEHAGFLRPVAQAYYHAVGDQNLQRNFTVASGDPATTIALALTETQKVHGPRQFMSWANWFTEDQFRQCFRDFALSLFCPDGLASKYWGFKEIRYGHDDKVLGFLGEVFPDATFIFLVRHPVDNIVSQLRALSMDDSPEVWAEKWVRQNGHFLDFAAANPNGHILRFEDFVAGDRKAARALLDTLGLAYTPAHDQVLQKIVDGVPDHRRREAALSPDSIAMISDITQDIAAQFGYKLPRHK